MPHSICVCPPISKLFTCTFSYVTFTSSNAFLIANPDVNVGDGSFTIEAWIRRSRLSTENEFWSVPIRNTVRERERDDLKEGERQMMQSYRYLIMIIFQLSLPGWPLE